MNRLGRVLVAAALLTGAACSKDPVAQKQAYLASGNAYVEEGKFAEAIIEYRNALQIDPKLGDAQKRLAEAYASTGDLQRAFEAWVRAADLLPADTETQLTAATYLLAANRAEDALPRIDSVIAQDAGNVQAHVLRGNALAGLSSFDDALAAIEQAIRLDPKNGTTFTHLGRVEMARGRRDEAESAFKRAVALAPESVEAHLALGGYYWSLGRAKETEEAFRGALAVDPANAPANRAMAAFTVASGRHAEAEQYLVRIAESSDDLEADFALADYYIAAGRPRDAVAHLERIPEPRKSTPLVGQRLARAYAASGDLPKAEALVDRVLSQSRNSVDARLLKSELLLNDGKTDEAFAAVQATATANPSSPEAQYALGRMYAARGDHAAATAAFREVLRLNPRAGAAQVELARLQLASGDAAGSVRTAEEAAQSQPGNLNARLTLVRSLLAAKDLARAERELGGLRQAYPNVAAVHTLSGALALLRNDNATARTEYARAVELDAQGTDALAGLIALDFRANNAAAAVARMEERLKSDTSAEALMLAAQTYWTARDAAGAERVLRQAIDTHPSLLTSYAMLGQLYMTQRKLDEARTEFEALAKKQDKPVGPLTMSGIILQAQGQNDLARRRYEEVLALDPRAAIAANNLAWLHAESGENLDIALQLAQTANAAVPESPEMMDTLGWVYYKRRLPNLAIPLFERSVEKMPDRASYRYHLGLAYLQSGDTARGRAALQAALNARPDEATAAEIRRALAAAPAPAPKS